MGIPVKLDAFEGPLDLLLHLIDKNKVNIYDIPIVEITNQYLEYIQEMKRQDLNIMSEFLVMAATLLDIKSRMLLPKEVNEEGEEEDPRQELVEKLLEYKMYKFMSYELREKQEDAALAMYKPATLPPEVERYRPEVKVSELLKDMTLQKLYSLYKSVIRRQENRIDPIRSSFGTLEKEEVDMDETWKFVEDYIRERGNCRFEEILTGRRTKMYTIIAFLVILELMKMGKITIRQDAIFDEIYIQAEDGLWDEREEEAAEGIPVEPEKEERGM
ncbi:MAG: segregation/condensation protein A [Candidatus Limivivens sp.]|nr:segregation/condensation protein A [Candidatus Limivivens sp.]